MSGDRLPSRKKLRTLSGLNDLLTNFVFRLLRKNRRVLVVDELLPDPTFGAGYPRACAIVRVLLSLCRRVEVYVLTSTADDVARMKELFHGDVKFHQSEGAEGLGRLLTERSAEYSAIFISRPLPMRAFLAAWKPRLFLSPRIIYDFEAVIAPREAQRRLLYGPAWSESEYADALVAEMELAGAAHVITTTSERDALLIRSEVVSPVRLLSHSISSEQNKVSFHDRDDFLFVGRLTGPSCESPNVDSVVWFVSHVMPIVDRLIGANWSLHVVGMTDSIDLSTIARERVIFHGSVDDLSRFYEACRIFVAPTRFAAGIPIKVIEAMGRGLPCVVTHVLAEQLDVTGEGFLAGASPLEFAKCCEQLYSDPVVWDRVKERGVAYVRKAFSEAAFRSALAQVVI